MPGFFEALENFNPKEIPKPTVEIQGKKLEVTPEIFQKVQKHGEENFELKNGKVILKPIFIIGKTYEILARADKGYTFHDHDPYYPKDIIEGGFAWQIKSE